MNLLTKDEILEADDLRHEAVDVPEWGGSVLAWGLTGEEVNAYYQDLVTTNGKDVIQNRRNAYAKLAARGIKDENGKRLFNDTEILPLGKKSGQALSRVCDVIMRLSGMTKEDIEAAEKNSDSSHGDSSGSDSPSPAAAA